MNPKTKLVVDSVRNLKICGDDMKANNRKKNKKDLKQISKTSEETTDANQEEILLPRKSKYSRDRILKFCIDHKRSISVFCVLIMLTVGWFGFVQKYNEQKASFPNEEDEISGERNVIRIEQKVVTMEEDFIIDEIYILDNTTLKIDGGWKIEVTGIGVLQMGNGSKITGSSAQAYYDFFIRDGGKVVIEDSIIENIHDSSGGGSGGLRVESDDVAINNSVIRDCQGNGITIYHSSPKIFNSQIYKNGDDTSDHGIEIISAPGEESRPFVSYCTINENFGAGIYIGEDSDPKLSYLNIYSNNDGIISDSSIFTDEKVTEFSSGYDTDVIDFYTGKTTDSSHSLSIPDGTIVSEASISFSKGSSLDNLEIETITLSDITEWERGCLDKVEVDQETSQLTLQKNNDKNANNLLFYVSFDDNPVPEVQQTDGEEDSFSDYTSCEGYSGNAASIEDDSSIYYEMDPTGDDSNINLAEGTFDFYIRPDISTSTGPQYIFSTDTYVLEEPTFSAYVYQEAEIE